MKWIYSNGWTGSVLANCVIDLCIPSEWITVPAYTDTVTPIIGDPGCLPTCRPLRSAVPDPIPQVPGYCQSRYTTKFLAVDMFHASYGFSSPLPFSGRRREVETLHLARYSGCCWNTVNDASGKCFLPFNHVLLYDVPLAIQLDQL